LPWFPESAIFFEVSVAIVSWICDFLRSFRCPENKNKLAILWSFSNYFTNKVSEFL
jgi:hypothetical protein